jgi:hypothetical protein
VKQPSPGVSRFSAFATEFDSVAIFEAARLNPVQLWTARGEWITTFSARLKICQIVPAQARSQSDFPDELRERKTDHYRIGMVFKKDDVIEVIRWTTAWLSVVVRIAILKIEQSPPLLWPRPANSAQSCGHHRAPLARF